MSAWKEYKEKVGTTRPWDLLNSNKPRATEQTFQERMYICEECPELIPLTKQCKQCGCLMKMKARLEDAKCPLSKW